MRMIFCSDYWNPLAPDAAYETEVNAAKKLGLDYSLVNFEALVEQQDATRAVRRVEAVSTEEMAIYRGWMLKPQMYERLYQVLAEKGLRLSIRPLHTNIAIICQRRILCWLALHLSRLGSERVLTFPWMR